MATGNPNDHQPARAGLSPEERTKAFAAIEADHPGWHCWQAVIPSLLYARRPNSSPPRVVRAPDVPGLRKAIEEDERAWRQRRGQR